MHKLLIFMGLAASALAAAEWKEMFNGKTLDGWEVVGDGVWFFRADGTLTGQRYPERAGFFETWPVTAAQYKGWRDRQSWLYTVRNDYDEFDLHLEYWLRIRGNSGISIRDTSRARYAIVSPVDFTKTPSKIGYEIQLNNQFPDPHPTGSIYTFVDAKIGPQIDNEWNAIDIESRRGAIRVRVNGQLVAEHPGDPKRSQTGPIGLQLHDQFSVAMYRNVRIREIGR